MIGKEGNKFVAIGCLFYNFGTVFDIVQEDDPLSKCEAAPYSYKVWSFHSLFEVCTLIFRLTPHGKNSIFPFL